MHGTQPGVGVRCPWVAQIGRKELGRALRGTVDRAEWPVSSHDPGTHAGPGLRGAGRGRSGPGLANPDPLCLPAPLLPSFYLSLPAYIFSLSTSFLEPSLGRLYRAQSPFRGDPHAPQDAQQRADTRATLGGSGGWGEALGAPPRCSVKPQRQPSSRARKSRAPNPPQTKPSNTQGSYGNPRFIFSPTLTLT